MRSEYTAVIKRNGKVWMGWVQEVPGVNAQEATRGKLLASLHEALTDVLRYNREQALRAAGTGYQEVRIAA